MKSARPDLEIRWKAFELRPDPVPLPNPNDEYRQMMWVKSIYPMAGRLGVKMRMPSRATRTRLAHEAAAWARSAGIGEPMNDALFRAYFERSEDIGDPEVLVRLAADIQGGTGDAQSLRESLSRHDHLPAVLADEQLAGQYGLSGVPAFICSGKGLVGVQDVDSLARLVSGS